MEFSTSYSRGEAADYGLFSGDNVFKCRDVLTSQVLPKLSLQDLKQLGYASTCTYSLVQKEVARRLNIVIQCAKDSKIVFDDSIWKKTNTTLHEYLFPLNQKRFSFLNVERYLASGKASDGTNPSSLFHSIAGKLALENPDTLFDDIQILVEVGCPIPNMGLELLRSSQRPDEFALEQQFAVLTGHLNLFKSCLEQLTLNQKEMEHFAINWLQWASDIYQMNAFGRKKAPPALLRRSKFTIKELDRAGSALITYLISRQYPSSELVCGQPLKVFLLDNGMCEVSFLDLGPIPYDRPNVTSYTYRVDLTLHELQERLVEGELTQTFQALHAWLSMSSPPNQG